MEPRIDISKIHTGWKSLERLNLILDEEEERYTQFLVLTDTNTSGYCYPALQKILGFRGLSCEKVEVASGDTSKSHESCLKIWRFLRGHEAGRHTLLMNLGGGMISDLGGFAASVFKRGVSFLNIPTSLMAQIDAAVGGKTGINFMGVKNQIGTFAFPSAVIVDPAFLETLPQREFVSAFSEMIKYALLSDEKRIKIINETFPDRFPVDSTGKEDLLKLINWGISRKIEIIGADISDRGNRKLLNLGHTVGHALEAWSASSNAHPLLHGEAIGAGLICELFISSELLGFPLPLAEEVAGYILQKIPRVSIPDDPAALSEFLVQDKKNLKGKLRFTLLESPGKGHIDAEVDFLLVSRSLEFYNKLCYARYH
ncbi:MAG: 3-dehydroquinate synthase [Bacteroidetes bacterium]|nr:3-dehydroquinate synthase [Bacteroidota bacterium]